MNTKTLSILLFLTLSLSLPAQVDFRVMFYNTENFFDTEDDPLTEDNEFLPSSIRRWTPKRYYHKLQRTAKVITAAGEWNTPALIGLCEVENDTVLSHLLRRTPLWKQQYRYVCSHGADSRGINVALLYQRDKFSYLGHMEFPVRFSRTTHKRTRHLLHVYGKIATGDTVDVFVCHFPSRYGGEKESEPDRLDAAHTLRSICDSLLIVRTIPYIILMGDFNDTPQNESMKIVAGDAFANLFSDRTSFPYQSGTLKYQGEWSLFDQIIVSDSFSHPVNTMRLTPGSARIFSPSFLLTKDKTWLGDRLFRTYYGFKYEGGYSDHLPVIVDFRLNP